MDVNEIDLDANTGASPRLDLRLAKFAVVAMVVSLGGPYFAIGGLTGLDLVTLDVLSILMESGQGYRGLTMVLLSPLIFLLSAFIGGVSIFFRGVLPRKLGIIHVIYFALMIFMLKIEGFSGGLGLWVGGLSGILFTLAIPHDVDAAIAELEAGK
jgi:hypothetical protein